MSLPLYSRFIGGNSVQSVLRTFKSYPFIPIFDYALEHNVDREQETYQVLTELRTALPRSTIAIKLSAFRSETLIDSLCEQARVSGGKILIDAEEVAIQDRIVDLTETMMRRHNQTDPVVSRTFQMYRIDAIEELHEWLHHPPYIPAVKLVRGAYYEEDHRTGKLYDQIEQTHQAYDKAIDCLLDYQTEKPIDVLIASHNTKSCQKLLERPNNFGCAQLLGMKDSLSYQMRHHGICTYKYVPFGAWYDTLPYLMRRLYENYEMLRHLK